MDIRATLTKHWNDSDWTAKTYTQKEGGENITVGRGEGIGKEKAVHFRFSHNNKTKELYPEKTLKEAVGRNLAYIAAYAPSKGIHAVGNACLGAINAVRGGVNWAKKHEAPFTPFWENLKQAGTSGIVALPGLFYLRQTSNWMLSPFFSSVATAATQAAGDAAQAVNATAQATVEQIEEAVSSGWLDMGANAFWLVGTAVAVSAVFHAVHNPLGFQETAHRFTKLVEPQPLSDAKVHGMPALSKAVHTFDGHYSLSRWLKMDYKGKADDDKFEEVKQD